MSESVAARLGAVHRRLDRHFDRALGPLGISHAQSQLLACLFTDGDMRAVDLAEKTGFETSTVSRLTGELRRRKLVTARPHPDDRRARLLGLAKRGEALRAPLAAVRATIHAQILRDIPAADLNVTYQTLALLEAAL